MRSIKLCRLFVLILLCLTVFAAAPAVLCQSQSSPQTTQTTRDDDVNLDTQLYLILATNREVDEGKIPAALDPIVKRLRETLLFKHYTIAGSFLNRVKNNGRLEVSWIGSPFMFPASSTISALNNPSFNNFGASVRLATDGSGNDIVRLIDLRFGAQVPIIVGQITTSNASLSNAPINQVNYQSIGLKTDVSIHEGSPVIAGTLNVGPQGDAIVVVVSARRAN